MTQAGWIVIRGCDGLVAEEHCGEGAVVLNISGRRFEGEVVASLVMEVFTVAGLTLPGLCKALAGIVS